MLKLNQNELIALISSLSSTINNIKQQYSLLNITDQDSYLLSLSELLNKLYSEYSTLLEEQITK